MGIIQLSKKYLVFVEDTVFKVTLRSDHYDHFVPETLMWAFSKVFCHAHFVIRSLPTMLIHHIGWFDNNNMKV